MVPESHDSHLHIKLPDHGKVEEGKVKANIDFDLLKGFFSDCDGAEQHADCAAIDVLPDVARLPYLKLLNCASSKVVVITPPFDMYCALSYVWGDYDRSEEQPPMDSATGTIIIENIPRTVQDRIKVVRGLGYRFV